MNFPDYIDRLAREAALGAVNISSSVIQQQINTQTSLNGFMTVLAITDNGDGSTNLVVADSDNNQQYVNYIGTDQIYLGKSVFVNNGYVQ